MTDTDSLNHGRLAVPAAYLGILLIWSTTPLGIKWSAEAGFLFGITARMVLAAVCFIGFALVFRRTIQVSKNVWPAYLVNGLGIYAAMMLLYWGAQFIPSGLMAVIFGLSPLTTGILSSIVLKERSMTVMKIGGSLVGVTGLLMVFGSQGELPTNAGLGIMATFGALVVYSVFIVTLKRIARDIPTFSLTAAGVFISALAFALTWIFSNQVIPVDAPSRSYLAIIYLAVVGSVVGFLLFFYILRRIAATKVALVTLITPVTALILGGLLNNEILPPQIWVGAGVILAGLLIHHLGDLLTQVFRQG